VRLVLDGFWVGFGITLGIRSMDLKADVLEGATLAPFLLPWYIPLSISD